MTQKVVTVEQTLKTLVLEAMANLVVAKAERTGAKDYHPLMISRFDIDTWIRSHGHEVPATDIQRTLEVLTMKDGPARYYDSQYNGRTYRYYGLTKKFWSWLESKSQQTVGATA